MPSHASLNFRLFTYWIGLPPGRGISLEEMMEAVDAGSAQALRSGLTRLRQGRVPDPSMPGTYLRPLPVRWNPGDRLYYDLSNMPSESIAAQIPGDILSAAVAQLLARVSTLDSSMGGDGLVRSAETLLGDADIRSLLLQLPLQDIWRAQDRLGVISRARQLLQLQQATGQLEGHDEEEGTDAG